MSKITNGQVSGTNTIDQGGTGATSFNTNAMVYSDGTKLNSDTGITTDGAGNLSATSMSTNGAQIITSGAILAMSKGFALP